MRRGGGAETGAMRRAHMEVTAETARWWQCIYQTGGRWWQCIN